MQKTSLLLLLFASLASASTPQLANFTAGEYSLVDGKAEVCGAGTFRILTEKDEHDKPYNVLDLGGLQGFVLDSKSGALPADMPDEKGCTYDFEDSLTSKGSETDVGLLEKFKCNGELVHTLTKNAFVTKDQVRLTAAQTGDPVFNYVCIWKKK